MSNGYNPSDEYQTLRNELLEAKKYVFERPLLIITASLALLNFIEKPYISLLPPIAIGLLMFNLWFTVNRMQSMARIVSYIQLELEEKSFRPWLGWETSLRFYRRWLKINDSQVKGIIETRIERDAVPDAGGFYPPIYLMHVIVVTVASLGSVVYLIINWQTVNIVLAIITLLLLFAFAKYAARYEPEKTKNLIEENRIIWTLVFEDLQKMGIKKNSG